MGLGPEPVLPREGVERALVLALRFVAAAADTGDAACWDAALDGAEAALGPRDGALLVARAAAVLRAARREGAPLRLLPPGCRRLSADEADLLALLRPGLPGRGYAGLPRSAAGLRAALCDLAAPLAAPLPSSPAGLVRTADRPAWSATV